MHNFNRLDLQNRTLLLTKLDGHVEAAVMAGMAQQLGFIEALDLTLHAFLREIVARNVPREDAQALWERALELHYPQQPAPVARHLN